MTRAILKFQLPVDDLPYRIYMPVHAKILHIGNQGNSGVLSIWADCEGLDKQGWGIEPGQQVPRYFRTFGTGHEIPDDMEGTFIGTVITASGALVWHVFEVPA